MIVIETKEKEWFCTNSMEIVKKICGKDYENAWNMWMQPFQYPCDFFYVIKDGCNVTESTPMRNWELDLPLSKCLDGDVQWMSKNPSTKPPKWYRDFMNTNWVDIRNKEKEAAIIANEKIEAAKLSGDKNAEFNAIIDYLLGN